MYSPHTQAKSMYSILYNNAYLINRQLRVKPGQGLKCSVCDHYTFQSFFFSFSSDITSCVASRCLIFAFQMKEKERWTMRCSIETPPIHRDRQCECTNTYWPASNVWLAHEERVCDALAVHTVPGQLQAYFATANHSRTQQVPADETFATNSTRYMLLHICCCFRFSGIARDAAHNARQFINSMYVYNVRRGDGTKTDDELLL